MRRAVQRLFWGGLAGKVLGLLREVLLAAAYGTGVPVAANRIAQTATLVPVDLFTADVLTAGFLPMHKALLSTAPERAAALFHGLRVALWVLAAVLTTGLLLGAREVVGLLAPGLDAETAGEAASFLRVMALGIPSYLQYSVLSYLEVSHGGFRLASARATGQNLGMIAALGLAWWLHRPVVMAWGFVGAYVVLHAWAHVSVRRRQLVPAWTWDRETSRDLLAQLWRRLRPLLLLPVVLQASVVVERAVASLMGTEVVAAVDYARYVAGTGVSLIAVPLGLAGLALLPAMDPAAARDRVEQLIAPLLLVVVPVSVLLAVAGDRVVDVLYARGAFDATAVTTSAQVLVGFGVGFWAQALAYVLVKVLNARDRNRRAAGSLVAGLLVTVAVDLGLYRQLGPLTIGLATSLGSVVTVVVAAHGLAVGRVLARTCALCAPGAVLAAVAGSVPGAAGWTGLLLAGSAVAVVWALAVVAIPPLRRVALDVTGLRRGAVAR